LKDTNNRGGCKQYCAWGHAVKGREGNNRINQSLINSCGHSVKHQQSLSSCGRSEASTTIIKVRSTRQKVESEGVSYGIHHPNQLVPGHNGRFTLGSHISSQESNRSISTLPRAHSPGNSVNSSSPISARTLTKVNPSNFKDTRKPTSISKGPNQSLCRSCTKGLCLQRKGGLKLGSKNRCRLRRCQSRSTVDAHLKYCTVRSPTSTIGRKEQHTLSPSKNQIKLPCSSLYSLNESISKRCNK